MRVLFERAFALMERRDWDKITVAVDLHDTVFLPTYSTEMATEFYDLAWDTLRLMTDREDIVMFRYSCITSQAHGFYNNFFKEKGIALYSPEYAMDLAGVKSNEYQDFSRKPYFNVLLDDKAGFDPNRDWVHLYHYFNEMP